MYRLCFRICHGKFFIEVLCSKINYKFQHVTDFTDYTYTKIDFRWGKYVFGTKTVFFLLQKLISFATKKKLFLRQKTLISSCKWSISFVVKNDSLSFSFWRKNLFHLPQKISVLLAQKKFFCRKKVDYYLKNIFFLWKPFSMNRVSYHHILPSTADSRRGTRGHVLPLTLQLGPAKPAKVAKIVKIFEKGQSQAPYIVGIRRKLSNS